MTSKKAALEALSHAQRELSTWTVLFHQSVAERVGLHSTDHKCLDLITRMEPVTAGDLARVTGLTTGAVTAVVDRLVNHGMVERQRDDTDRRKVFVRCDKERSAKLLGPVFEAFGRQLSEALAPYTVAELKLITDFSTKAASVLRDEVQRANDVKAKKGRAKRGS